MANTKLQIKRSNVSGRYPNTIDPANAQYIAAGELALNMADGVLYTSNGSEIIAVGAKQTTFQSTTITVSDTFQIGDIATQLLLANSTEIFAGNTSTNVIVSTTIIGVSNSTSNSNINAQKIFVGNSVTNAQFNLIGGSANLEINAFSFDVTTGIATFGTTTEHNLIVPTRGTYVNLYNLTGPARAFNGKYEVASVLTTNTFTVANVSFGGTVNAATSVSRTNGISTLKTTDYHNFGNGSQIIVSGVGSDYADLNFTFDGTYTVVDTIAESTTIKYSQYPIITAYPNYMFKRYNDNFVTYITPSAHNFEANHYISTNAYPTGVSTPLVMSSSVNAVAFATLNLKYDKATKAVVGKSIYMLVDNVDKDHKLFGEAAIPPISITTYNNTYQTLYTTTITSAFLDQTKVKGNAFGKVIIVTTADEIVGTGDLITSGFTGYWAFINSKQLPITPMTQTQYNTAVSKLGIIAPGYNRFKCFYLNVADIVSIPDASNLPLYDESGAQGVIRIPTNLGVSPAATAAQISSDPYIIRIDGISQQAGVDYAETSWGKSGAFKPGVTTNFLNEKIPFSTNWNSSGVVSGDGIPRVTVNISPFSGISAFNVDQYVIVYDVSYRLTNAAKNTIGIFKITSIDSINKTITFQVTDTIKSRYYYYNAGIRYYNSGTLLCIEPFVAISNSTVTAQLSRAYGNKTLPVSIVNSTAFTMPLLGTESLKTEYGNETAPLPVLTGRFTRNTDIPLRNPKTPPAKISYSSAGSVAGNVHIEYSSYVEVVNSTAAIRVTPSTFYNGNTTANLFSNSSTMAISSTTDAMQLAPTGFSLTGSTSGKYDPSKPVLSVNSSIFKIGTGLKGITIDGTGKIKQYGSELDIGTEIANVMINDYSITINSDNLQTTINTSSAVFSGNVSIAGSLYVDSSYGEPGQVLSTDGVTLTWIDSGLNLTDNQSFSGNVYVADTLFANTVDVNDEFGNETKISAEISNYIANTFEQLTIAANSIVLTSNNVSINSVSISSNSIRVGNSTINVSINSSSFSGKANNTLYVGSVTAANVVSNSQLSGNLANYQTTAGLSGNVATLAANSTTYVNGKTEGNLNVNSAVNANSANNASYLGTIPASNYVNTSGNYTLSGVINHTANIVVNGAIIAAGISGTAGQVLTSNGSGNVYWSTVTSGGAGSLTSISTGDGLTGGPITSTGTISVLANSGIIANAYGLFVNTSYIATLAANSAAYLGSVAATNYVTATNLSNNLANYAAASSVTANADTAYSNAATYADNKAATAYTNATSYADTKAGAAYSNAIAYSGNSALAYVNAVSYVDGKYYINATGNYTISGIYNYTANLVVNGAIIAGGTSGTAGQVLTSNASGNVYWATVGTGGIGSVTSIASGNGLFGGPITSTGTLYVLANSGIISNTTGVFVNTSYIATLAANSAAYLGSVAATNYVTATNLSNNLANYSTTTATTSNAATAYSNAALYTDNRILTVNSAITSNAATAYTNAMADTLSRNGTYTGNNIFQGTNSVFTSNVIMSGANIYFSGKTTHAANLVLNTGISVIDSTGSQGSLGQVLSSNGSGNVYWRDVSGGSSWIGGELSNTAYFSNTAASTNAVSGAVTVLGGLGVANNIYTGGRFGFSNSTNISVAYTVYNQTLNTIDTVFG
jgi:hypothetical protein